MTTREPSNPANQWDDAPVHIVGHRLQKVDEPPRVNAGANGRANTSASDQRQLHSQIRTPANPPRPPTRAPAPLHQLPGQAPERSTLLRQVVLVDRDIDALRDIAIALRDQYDFHITISGTEALNLLRDSAIDTIVVGQTLYSSTGLNVLAEARRQAPHTHRVLLANAVEAGAVERGASAVAPFQVMTRPCTADKLRLILEATSEEDAARDDDQAAPVTPKFESAPSPPNERVHSDTHDPADFEHVVMETAPEPIRARSKANGKDAGAKSGADTLPVIVYTDNAEFYQAISLALQDRHTVRLCTQLERVAEAAEMGMCPLLITDRAGTQVEFQRISVALRALDGSIVIIASGPPEVGAAFRKLLGTSALHSFLLKPLSTPLVRLAVEAAKRHYLQVKSLSTEQPELKATTTASPFKAPFKTRALTPSQNFLPSYRDDFNVDNFEDSLWRAHAPKFAIAAGVLVLAGIVIGGGYYWWQHRSTDAQQNNIESNLAQNNQKALAAEKNSESVVIATDLALAQRAYDAGHFATPSDSSALFYYSQILARAPQNPDALAGRERALERIIEQAEKSLLDERLDAASEAIATVRTLEPKNKRLPFLESQLDKARRQLVATRTNNAVTTSAPETNAPISNETQRQQLVARWITTARQRLMQDRLITPENDNAEFYFRQAERADPENISVRQGLREIGARLLVNARDALTRQQLELAKRRANDALRFGADRTAVDKLLADADAQAGDAARSNYLRLALQRTRENRLFEPDRDSARYYLGQLQRLDPAASETEQATRALALKLIENANQATAQQQTNTAQQLLNEVRRMGFSGSELTDAEARLRTSRNPSAANAAARTAAPVTAPKIIKTASPKFPDEAMRAGVAGWVDVGFRIAANGDVTDVSPVASNPPGQYAEQFERAAVAAIRQYKFEARNISDQEFTQRMVVRVQFKLQ